ARVSSCPCLPSALRAAGRSRCGRAGYSRTGGSRRAGSGGGPRAVCPAGPRMGLEHARPRRLPRIVANHLPGHQQRNVLLAVVDAEGQPDELRQDGRAPAPDPDHLVAARRARRLRLLEQIAVDERTFPNRTRHDAVLAYLFRAWRLAMMNLVV